MTKGTPTISRLLDLQVTLRRAPYKPINVKLAHFMLTKVAVGAAEVHHQGSARRVARNGLVAAPLSGVHLKALRAVCAGVLDWLGPEP